MQALVDRGYDVSLYTTTWINEEENVATFPLYNLHGCMTGYQQYRPDVTNKKCNHPKESRYFTYKPRGVNAMFGIESLYFRNDILFVQEGVFDVCKLHSLGVPAIAILSSKDTQALLNLKLLGRKLYSICDGDKAGRVLSFHVDGSIILPEEMDAGDLTLEETREIVNKLLNT